MKTRDKEAGKEHIYFADEYKKRKREGKTMSIKFYFDIFRMLKIKKKKKDIDVIKNLL